MAMVIVAAAVAVFWPREKEPEYQGKKLSEWIRVVSGNGLPLAGPGVGGAADAVRAMGTNALPFLVRWVAYEPSKLRSGIIRQLYVWRVYWAMPLVMQPLNRALRAQWALSVLGPAARPAVPELARIALQGRNEEEAMWALFSLGETGVPGLLEIVERGGSPEREEARRMLSQLCQSGIQLSEVVPAFLCVDGERRKGDGGFGAAPGPLMLIFLDRPTLPLPQVTACLTHSNAMVRVEAAVYLGWLGQEAASAGDALEQTLTDPDLKVRSAATNAVKRIVGHLINSELEKAWEHER